MGSGTAIGTAEYDALFVIGGIGVTPMLPMIEVAQQRGTDWRAIYVGRSREYMPFLDEVVSVSPDRVTVWADDEQGGIATVDDLLAVAGPTTAVYVCGPTGMLDAVRVARNEHANAPLHYERFSPAAGGRRSSLRAGTRAVEAAAERAGESVGPGRHARSRSVHPVSCQPGYCGTCKVKVLAGQVDHRGRTVVGDDEMLVCMSRAKGERLVIDA